MMAALQMKHREDKERDVKYERFPGVRRGSSEQRRLMHFAYYGNVNEDGIEMLQNETPLPSELDLHKDEFIPLNVMADPTLLSDPPAPDGMPLETYRRTYVAYPVARSQAVYAWNCYRGEEDSC